MVVLKPLHLASSVSELQSNARVGDLSKSKVKQLCESSDKLWKKANENKDEGEVSINVAQSDRFGVDADAIKVVDNIYYEI